MWFVVAAWAGVRTATVELERAGEPPLPVRATWADGTGPMPVIVFSHGMGGSRDGYVPLARAWAEHGYLVLQPTHPDSLANAGFLERWAAIRDPEAFVTDPQNLAAWDERPREVALVLDRLDAWAAVGVDPTRIDREHVGIGGHSFGAHTAMLCGGLGTARIGSRFEEPRADAILLMSPQGTGNGITATSYATITRPTLVVTGSEDRSRGNGKGPEWRLEAWEGLGATDRWLLWLDGADHSLGGVSGRRATPSPTLQQVLDTTTAFWDATLRGDEGARARLPTTPAPGGTRPGG